MSDGFLHDKHSTRERTRPPSVRYTKLVHLTFSGRFLGVSLPCGMAGNGCSLWQAGEGRVLQTIRHEAEELVRILLASGTEALLDP